MSVGDDPATKATGSEGGVTVFWRPGCGFCAVLRRRLRATGLDYDEVNIWDDASGAAYVRSVAGGNETVPTVRIGDVGLVNPTARQVVAEVERRLPDLAARRSVPASRPGLLARLRGRPAG